MLLALPCRLLPVARTVGRQLARVVVTFFSMARNAAVCQARSLTPTSERDQLLHPGASSTVRCPADWLARRLRTSTAGN